MSDDSKELSRVEDILSGEDYLPKKPMSRVEELLMDGAMVPKVDDTDNGKVLKVIDGEWQPGEDVSGDNLPPVSSLDNGKVLKVVSGEWNIGDDKSESSFVYIGSSYPFSGSKVALPSNINSVLIANYTSSPKVPTFLVTSNNIIFEPKEVDVSSGTTPSIHIRWGRMYSEFDSATQEKNIYNDSLSYNTQNQTTEASYYKTKAIPTIPSVDSSDNNKVMQVSNGQWVANLLPTVDGVPAVEQADVGKVLKATAVGEYDWAVDAGGVEVVRLSKAAYDALTTEQKNNGKMYFIDSSIFVSGIPRVSGSDSKITASTNSNTAWIAFDGNDHTPGSDEDGWSPENGSDQWLKYHFTSATPINKVKMKLFNRNTSSYTGSVYVEGSNDNITWENIMTDASSFSVTLSDRNMSSIEYVKKCNGYTYEYIRIRANQNTWKFAVAEFDADISINSRSAIYYMSECYTPDELPAVSSGDSGKVLAVNSTGAWDKATLPPAAQIVQISQLAYDELTIAEKEDPTKLYMISALATYEFHSAENGQVVVRIGPDGTKWFVNGLSIDAYGWDVPSDLEQYIPNASIYANRYTSATASSPDKGFGFTTDSWGAGYLFNWNGSIGSSFSGTTYGVLNNTGGSTQTLPYTDPYQVDDADKLRIYYMNQLYSNLPIYKEVTQQEYDDLPSSKNSDGIIYFING